jgi:hypothetical protein
VEAVAEAARRRDWATVEQRYLALPGAAARFAAVTAVGDIRRVDQMLYDVVRSGQGGSTARIFQAQRAIILGWEIRTGARAKEVGRDRFARFHAYLCQAEENLHWVVAQEPENVIAWTQLLTTARGLSRDPGQAQVIYLRVGALAPHFLPAQWQRLLHLLPKWGGSWEAAQEFTSTCVTSAPPGSLSPVLMVHYHLERSHFRSYLRRPEVAAEVDDAAAQSVLNPAFRPGPGWVDAHSAFALYYSLAGNRRAAARHFRAMGRYATDRYWRFYLNQDWALFQVHRTLALARG